MAAKYANETSDDFLGRMATTLNEGYKALAVAFGLQTGLFKTMIELSPTPKTSQEIADAGNFKERYVREWLGVMVCGGIVDIDRDTEKYHLPAHRVSAFREGDMESLTAAWCKGVPMMSEAYDVMLEAIKKDGPRGVPYSKYKSFHAFEADCSILWFSNHLCQSFISSHPALKRGLENGFRVLDVGCGRGGASRNIAVHFPQSKVTGLDISEEALKYAKEAASAKNLTNLNYVHGDASSMPEDWTNTFDYAFIYDVVHDVPRPDLILAEIRRVLKPGAMFSCFDPNMHSKHADNIEVPHAVTLYTISLFHCLPVSYQFPGSMGLGTCFGREEAVKLFEKCGFTVQAVENPVQSEDMLHYHCTANPYRGEVSGRSPKGLRKVAGTFRRPHDKISLRDLTVTWRRLRDQLETEKSRNNRMCSILSRLRGSRLGYVPGDIAETSARSLRYQGDSSCHQTFEGIIVKMASKYVDETSDDFLGRMATTLNEGYKALAVAFGLETGLYKTMIELSPTPKTSQEIADAGNFKERYVREWLGVMVCGGIVDVDRDTEKYYLPAHRVPAFREEDTESLTATLCRGLPMISDAYDVMLEVIKKDGPLGVPYSKYKSFYRTSADYSNIWISNHLCQSFMLSHPTLKEGLENGFRVLDIGCGRGGASRNIALNFPQSKVTGLDISEEALKYAKEAASAKNLTNLDYVYGDASSMPEDWTNTFDYAFVYDVVHDVPRPDLMLAEIQRVLKPGAMFSCFDPNMHSKHADNIEVPHATALYTMSLFHCLPVSYQFPGSMGLGTCWGREEAVKLFKKCGFTVQAVENPVQGDAWLHYYCTANSQCLGE
ncbi:uncharacterized protein [Diadema setosum]|uniref:uncharacterized protein n=1 Tax=Diadema setosum TaxID=31175 RepID=UPI003B3A381B